MIIIFVFYFRQFYQMFWNFEMIHFFCYGSFCLITIILDWKNILKKLTFENNWINFIVLVDNFFHLMNFWISILACDDLFRLLKEIIHNFSYHYFHMQLFVELLNTLHQKSSNCVLISKRGKLKDFPGFGHFRKIPTQWLWIFYGIIFNISLFPSSNWTISWRRFLTRLSRVGVTIVASVEF